MYCKKLEKLRIDLNTEITRCLLKVLEIRTGISILNTVNVKNPLYHSIALYLDLLSHQITIVLICNVGFHISNSTNDPTNKTSNEEIKFRVH